MDNNDRARFLDQLMSEEEHGSTLAHLVDSDEDIEVVGDAAYLLRELEAEEGIVVVGDRDDDGPPPPDDTETGRDAKVLPTPPPSTRRGWGRVPARWIALAAVLAGVVLVPLALSRSGSREPGDFASLLANRSAGLPPGKWWARDRWSINRGEGGPSADLPLAAKLGALQMALEVAAAGGQAEATELLAGRIVGMLTMPGSGAVAAAYQDIAARASEPAETLAPSVVNARESLVAFLDEDYFSLGAWTEAAAIAARRRDTAFFHASASRKLLDHAASLPSLDYETRAVVETIRTAAAAEQPDWTTLAKSANDLLHRIAQPAFAASPDL
jgi:hypothetical protein